MACESCRYQARTLLRVANRTSVLTRSSAAARSNFLPLLSAPVQMQTPPSSRSFSSTGSRKILGIGGSIGESYRVIGASERIFKACSKAADYRITEEERKNDQVGRLEDGEEIGRSTEEGNIWHNSMAPPSIHLESKIYHVQRNFWLTFSPSFEKTNSFQALSYL